MIGPLIWYQICNFNHHNFEEILNFQFSKMSSYSWICPLAMTVSLLNSILFYGRMFLTCCLIHTIILLKMVCFLFHREMGLSHLLKKKKKKKKKKEIKIPLKKKKKKKNYRQLVWLPLIINDLIHLDQSGFLKGRNIGNHVRLFFGPNWLCWL